MRLGRAAIFGHEENDGLQDTPLAGCPFGEGGDGREEPTRQLHTRLVGEVIEKIRDFVEWGGGRLCGDHQFRGCGFSGHGFHTRDLVAAAHFGLGFLGPAFFLVAVTLGCEGASVTG